MISQEQEQEQEQQPASKPTESPPCSPRISFSADFLDDADFISITPNPDHQRTTILKSPDFEFLSACKTSPTQSGMLPADQLFFQGKFLPFRQHPQKITPKEAPPAPPTPAEPRIWFIDDDPSPRPPKCTVLWKELLRLRKSKSTTNSLSPSSSSSSSSSSLGDHVAAIEGGKKSPSNREKHVTRIKKGLERTKSAANIRLRPMVNVPICAANTQLTKNTSLPPLIPLKKRQTA